MNADDILAFADDGADVPALSQEILDLADQGIEIPLRACTGCERWGIPYTRVAVDYDDLDGDEPGPTKIFVYDGLTVCGGDRFCPECREDYIRRNPPEPRVLHPPTPADLDRIHDDIRFPGKARANRKSSEHLRRLSAEAAPAGSEISGAT